jgi:hypothetical protein
MPSRWSCLVIIAAWLLVTGWLFWHDLLPHLLPGQPPPYSVELVEEAQTTRPYAEWSLRKNNVEVSKPRTRIKYLQPGGVGDASESAIAWSNGETHFIPGQQPIFELSAEIRRKPTVNPPLGASKTDLPPFPANGVLVEEFKSCYFVDLAGILVGLWARVDGRIDPTSPLARVFVGQLKSNVEGDMEAGRIVPRLSRELAPLRKLAQDLPSIQSGEVVLFPLHPVNRHRGLFPGKSWHARLLDPLSTLDHSVVSLAGHTGDLPLLVARVRSKEEWIVHKGRDVACLVIDYSGDYANLTTWVARKTGLVMRQDAKLENVHWVMKRE